ncbi:hypothetical protein SLS60_009572 [Paraconiothyrium brasiliense]|uniref:Uncharacterized protein n=1 Tax=Paraconiothyrium brasiliense TaxID=300254 RepID=A0ABR3QUP2_9PLEO
MSKVRVLGVFTVALAGVARAAPQRLGIGIVPIPTVFPVTNSTTAPSPTPTDSASTCEASCDVQYPELFGLSWAREDQVVFTETVTVGTVTISTLTQRNTTYTLTDTYYNEDVPRSYTLYQQGIDKGGTKTVEATITLSDGEVPTIFAYPTPWVDYPAAYHWQGIVPTHDEKSVSVCATSTEELAFGEVTQHPLYPQPTDIVPDKNDPEGINYVPLWIALQELPEKKWFDQAFPAESAFAYCTSVQGKPASLEISTAKFVLATATFATSLVNPGFIHPESTVTGWEDGITTTDPPNIFEPTQDPTQEPSRHPDSSHGDISITRIFPRPPTIAGPKSTSIQVPDIPDIVTSVPPWDPQPTVRPSPPLVNVPTTPHTGDGQPAPTGGNNVGQPAPSPGNVNGVGQPPTNSNGVGNPIPDVNNPGGRPAATPTTPVFTFVPTTINGRPTATPVFILPGASSIATIGQTVTFNGQTSILAAPSAIFAFIPTTINGVATSAPGFIISGTSTATIGQTITLDGQPTILAAPAPFATEIPTTLFGIETHVTAYIISGSITAFPGQTITLDGQVTALPTADAVFTSITTTIDGKETLVPAYIISGSSTATIGQTVIIDGTSTVLSTPTADVVFTSVTTTINGKETVIPAYVVSGSTTATIGQIVTLHGTTTILGWPTQTEASAAAYPTNVGQPSETASEKKGAGTRISSVQLDVVLLTVGAFIVSLL